MIHQPAQNLLIYPDIAVPRQPFHRPLLRTVDHDFIVSLRVRQVSVHDLFFLKICLLVGELIQSSRFVFSKGMTFSQISLLARSSSSETLPG